MSDTIEPLLLQHQGPPDVSLWRIDLHFDMSLDAAAFACLSHDERERARNFRQRDDALRFASTRAALRELLAQRMGVEAHAVRFALDANRRPRLADSTAPDFNVSHAGGFALIAMSNVRRVGVDIEQHSDRFDWRSIMTLTLDPDETAWIERLDPSEQMAAFYDAWTAKEALVKTTGGGITRGLQHLAVLPREGNRVMLRNAIAHDMREIAAQWIGAPYGYAGCVAWSMSMSMRPLAQ
jgi:4'-phosphopantetheinyl transferase